MDFVRHPTLAKASVKALPLALALARREQAKLILLHMIDPMPATTASLSAYAPAGAAADEVKEWEGSSRQKCLRQLRECLPAETNPEQEIEFVVGTDFLPEGVLTASEKFHADLIVMGANHTASAKVAAHIPWSAVHEVVRYAPCPVLDGCGVKGPWRAAGESALSAGRRSVSFLACSWREK